MQRTRIAVIGAGAAGLSVARHFVPGPTYEVVIYEQSDQVGGTWVYREEVPEESEDRTVHSSMYINLRTNLSKETMAFPDMPFPDDLPTFVGHRDVRQYLTDYSMVYDIEPHIRFHTRVTDVRPVTDRAPHGVGDAAVRSSGECTSVDSGGSPLVDIGPRWQVTARSLDGENGVAGATPVADQQETFDAVFVCNGHYFQPLAPTIPGLAEHFRGNVMHSHSYRRPDTYHGQVVVVAGTGSSGQDICLDVASKAQRVLVSAHRDHWIKSPLPSNIEQRRRIKCIDEHGGVVFDDGHVDRVDSILWCTGYACSFPFLHDSCGVSVELDRVVKPLYRHLVNAAHPTMFFIAIPFLIAPFPLMAMQALFAKAVLERRHTLPSFVDMARWQDDDLTKRSARGLPPHYAHALSGDQWDYDNELARLAGSEPLPPHYKALYEYTKGTRAVSLTMYRNVRYQLRDDDALFDAVDVGGCGEGQTQGRT
eukprot:scpid70511/ scgid34734/ Flavin-containing monooxygenase FMO GS-OX-like 5; Flavin-monooxygenase glucosinolate S-oxygenase-like 5